MKISQFTFGLCFAAVAVCAAPAYAQAPGKAMGPAPGKTMGPHPHANCVADIRRERATYHRNLEAGIKGGRIDPKEHAMLNKTHADLMAMEKKAAEDHKMSASECKAIHAKIMEEHKRLQMAMATPARKGPPPAAKK